jgi:hypothetical protein
LKRLLGVVAVMAVAFLAGYGAMYWNARNAADAAEKTRQDLQRQLTDTQDRLRAAEIEGKLGLLLIEVEQNNYGDAQARSTKLFDDVRTALFASRDEAVRQRLTTLLQHRDEVTASLTALKPGTVDLLRKFYREFAGAGAGHQTAH